MAVTLRYFTEFGKSALQKTMCGGIYARVYCIFSACTMSSQRKFTFAISSPDEFLVIFCPTEMERHLHSPDAFPSALNIYGAYHGTAMGPTSSRKWKLVLHCHLNKWLNVSTWRLAFDFIVTELEFISVARFLISHDVILRYTNVMVLHCYYDHQKVHVTSSNINRFSILFHYQN